MRDRYKEAVAAENRAEARVFAKLRRLTDGCVYERGDADLAFAIEGVCPEDNLTVDDLRTIYVMIDSRQPQKAQEGTRAKGST